MVFTFLTFVCCVMKGILKDFCHISNTDIPMSNTDILRNVYPTVSKIIHSLINPNVTAPWDGPSSRCWDPAVAGVGLLTSNCMNNLDPGPCLLKILTLVVCSTTGKW